MGDDFGDAEEAMVQFHSEGEPSPPPPPRWERPIPEMVGGGPYRGGPLMVPQPPPFRRTWLQRLARAWFRCVVWVMVAWFGRLRRIRPCPWCKTPTSAAMRRTERKREWERNPFVRMCVPCSESALRELERDIALRVPLLDVPEETLRAARPKPPKVVSE